MQHIGVEVEDVEAVPLLADLGQHGQVRRHVGRQRVWVQSDRLVAASDQSCPGIGFGAGEQRDVVTEIHQRVAQVGDHTFRPAIELWWDSFK